MKCSCSQPETRDPEPETIPLCSWLLPEARDPGNETGTLKSLTFLSAS